VLSNDETLDLSHRFYMDNTVWETICTYPFSRPIKYVVVHSIAKYLDSKGKIETRYSAQLNLARGGFGNEI